MNDYKFYIATASMKYILEHFYDLTEKQQEAIRKILDEYVFFEESKTPDPTPEEVKSWNEYDANNPWPF